MTRVANVATGVLVWWLAACGSDGGGSPTDTSPAACQPGTALCECVDGGCPGAAGLVCVEGECIHPGCTVGRRDCFCDANGQCDAGLACTDGRCTDPVPEECRAGQKDCPCAAGGECLAGLLCVDELCVVDACPPGQQDCRCGVSGTCGDGLVCQDDVCIAPPPCPAGDEGCACNGSRCGVNSRGETLACVDGICASATCAPGAAGCVCELARLCDGGLVCNDGRCMDLAACVTGEADCPCTAAGGCAPGLSCRDGAICVASSGFPGETCRADGTCVRGARCNDGLCEACTLGTRGCACADAVCYGANVCSNGACLDPSSVPAPVPTNPICYTHCASSITDATGAFRPCGADGLMEGCLGEFVCERGSCVLPGESAPDCTTDGDCAAWQTCLEGGCYSTCQADRDCHDGFSCSHRVCRRACNSASDSCGVGEACDLYDGVNGYCLPVAAPSGTPQLQVFGGIEVDPPSFDLSGLRSSVLLSIKNDSAAPVTARVRRQSHNLIRSAGPPEQLVDLEDGVACDPLVDCPLWWLELALDGSAPSSVPELEVTLAPNETKRVRIQISDAGVAAVRWTGQLEVVSDHGAEQVVLSWAERPDGQWQGRAVYFASFEDENLDAWVDSGNICTGVDPISGKTASTLQTQIRNAFAQKWTAFRCGRITWEEMQAVMRATETEGWRATSQLPECQRDACYLYGGDADGIGDYADVLTSTPIPQGATELPLSLHLYTPSTATPRHMVGRIESSTALHYAGDPAVTLDFKTGPYACDRTDSKGNCISFVTEFTSEVQVGGRYLTDASDTTCRERPGAGSSAGGYTQAKVPWLLPGFQRDTELDPATSQLYRYECRDEALPFDPAAGDPDPIHALNRTLAGSNPIPDGRKRVRSIVLIDGVMLNGSQLVVLFRETMPSFMDPSDTAGIRTYGYMVLENTKARLDPADADLDGVPNQFEGNAVADTRPDPAEDLLAVSCSDALLDTILAPGETLGVDTAPRVINALIAGVADTAPPTVLGVANDEQVHYLCADTGLFDGGPGNVTRHGVALATRTDTCAQAMDGACQDGGPLATSSQCALGTDTTDCGPRQTDDADPRVRCPAESAVEFFTVSSSGMSQADIARLDCQQDGSCGVQLEQWKASPDPLINLAPVFQCASGGAYCDLNRLDLRDGKQFLAATDPVALFQPFRAETEAAFRYKVRFQNRRGTSSVGFAPDLCVPGSNQVPYCYDPGQIEGLADRVDCLLHIWDSLEVPLQQVAAGAGPAALAAGDALDALDSFLVFNFSAETQLIGGDPNRVITKDGFERLYAELLIMMGDESYTRAFASRFDLAEQQQRSFAGALFEEDGINLSGVAGFEMYSLYQAAQYYQTVLDRFYAMSPLIWQSVQDDLAEQNQPSAYHRETFVTPALVTTYIARVLRASTQKSRAWSQIAEHYQALNRPELARRVIERAYTATYLESMALSRVVQKIHDIFQEADRPQIDQVLTDGSRRFRMAMLDMRKVYDSIADKTTIFGLDPEVIPFPTLSSINTSEDNAFQKLVVRAWQRLQIASQREQEAIVSNRSYETDAAQFQSELTQIRNTYEAQLGSLCGTFQVDDDGDGVGDRVYPATRRYASLNPHIAPLGDPCGHVGNGAIHDGMAELDGLSIDMKIHLTRYGNLFAQIDNEKARVDEHCELIEGLASYALCVELGEQCRNVPDDDSPVSQTFNAFTLESAVASAKAVQGLAQAFYESHINTLQLQKCEPPSAVGAGDCPLALVAATESRIVGYANTATQKAMQLAIDTAQWQVQALRTRQGVYQTRSQCESIKIDSEATTKNLLLGLAELDLEVLRTQHQVQLAYANIERLRNEARRLELEEEEAEQMAINVEAARNDPNVRIYKNDAIINADVTFKDALRQVYRATRVFEYYTSQSYAAREQLYLIRMIQHGDYNLENYLIELENAFAEFEEQFGDPDLRVEVLSLKNDLLRIPWTDEAGRSLTNSERTELMRAKLRDPALLDGNGYLTIPFRTSTDQLSPLTKNHKLQWIEVDLQASEWGDDDVGRVYLRQKGTGTVSAISGSDIYYRFPERTAVVDVIFMGTRSPLIDPDVYRSWRFRDRPYANTAWELVLNQRDEPANMDIDLQSLSDLKLYLYYNDFTAL